MLTEISVSAPAKINVGLKVLPVRDDGFHSIESIFQTVGLYDELTVKLIDGFGRCEVSCADIVLPKKNTIESAYKAFSEVYGKIKSVSVSLKKGIPSGGGLGGGSSDAAAFVCALEKLNDVKLSDNELDSIAAKVGSDVFFFLRAASGAAIVTGRGEIVRHIKRRNDLTFLLVFPHVSSSTKEAYDLIDEFYSSGCSMVFPEVARLEEIYNSPLNKWTFKNSFTAVLKSKYAEIGNALTELSNVNAPYCEMSGSGSTSFGVFYSFGEAQAAAEKLKADGFKCAVVQ
ncbi:MAG: 4-(cytidine 5'-diphospho)-2-C-methyl-D-erythritol kinase [Treponema sp.]